MFSFFPCIPHLHCMGVFHVLDRFVESRRVLLESIGDMLLDLLKQFLFNARMQAKVVKCPR